MNRQISNTSHLTCYCYICVFDASASVINVVVLCCARCCRHFRLHSVFIQLKRCAVNLHVVLVYRNDTMDLRFMLSWQAPFKHWLCLASQWLPPHSVAVPWVVKRLLKLSSCLQVCVFVVESMRFSLISLAFASFYLVPLKFTLPDLCMCRAFFSLVSL